MSDETVNTVAATIVAVMCYFAASLAGYQPSPIQTMLLWLILHNKCTLYDIKNKGASQDDTNKRSPQNDSYYE